MIEENKKENKTGLYIAIILIIMLSGFSIYNYLKYINKEVVTVNRVEKFPVSVKKAELKPIDVQIIQTGNILPVQSVMVFSKIPGKIIKKIVIEKGYPVKAGDVIAFLERDVVDAQLREAETGLISAKANLKQVEANLLVVENDKSRIESLYNQKAMAKQKLDHILAQYNMMQESVNLANAQIERAKAVIKQLNVLSENHTIKAPIDGIISKRFVDQGSMSSPGSPLVEIIDKSIVKIITTVTERDFPNIKKGIEAEIKVDAFPGKLFSGEITLISPSIDPLTRTGEIEIHINNEKGEISPGMFSRVKLKLGKTKKLVIPGEGINQVPGTGDYFVYIVQNNTAVMKNVEVGEFAGPYVEILAGIAAGDSVIIKGQTRVKDGSEVEIVK
ncbi:MAG: efflux RND transporter periplasmic adaptor subunit [Desulfobacterales bacterium]|jgi:membrane fusion protein, multidrug efflux system|nr:efflux RND transporter periplasmic adaptor subunit [Desulfobacteraceae bacterium]MBT7086675.1 efflux RND transporter periplasmic adaptor subunit [Desulfobacterales bacterium]